MCVCVCVCVCEREKRERERERELIEIVCARERRIPSRPLAFATARSEEPSSHSTPAGSGAKGEIPTAARRYTFLDILPRANFSAVLVRELTPADVQLMFHCPSIQTLFLYWLPIQIHCLNFLALHHQQVCCNTNHHNHQHIDIVERGLYN